MSQKLTSSKPKNLQENCLRRQMRKIANFRGRTSTESSLSPRRTPSLGLPLIFIVSAFIILFPGVSLFIASPMYSATWGLQDPVVSFMTFIPGTDSLQFELLSHGNLLWSNLRNMGTPLLANEIQAAPLFPLTLMFLWIPQPFFWNALVISRMLLLAFGAMLVAQGVLRLGRTNAILFVLIFAYSVYICRWLNHPYINGVLAGIWLIYFVERTFQLASETWTSRRWLNVMGIMAASYSLITCGFPEASAMSVVLVFLIFIPKGFHTIIYQPRSSPTIICDCFLGVLGGTFLASPQLFAFLEYLSLTSPDFRPPYGLHQFASLSELLKMVTRVTAVAPPAEITHFFGLVTATLFVVGVIDRIVHPRKINLVDVMAILAIGFYLLKCFPIWVSFNYTVSKVPLLRQSWFTVYYLPILLFGYAIIAARGLSCMLSSRKSQALVFVLCGSAVIALVTSWSATFLLPSQVGYVTVDLVLYASFVITIVILLQAKRPNASPHIAGICIAFVLLESILNTPRAFLAYASQNFETLEGIDRRFAKQMAETARLKGLTIFNMREASTSGAYVGAGFGTVDNGASAVLTQRAQLLRTRLFVSDWNGYLPLQTEKRKGAYQIVGRNLIVSPPGQNLPEGFELLIQSQARIAALDRGSPGRMYVAKRCVAAAAMKDAADLLSDENRMEVGDVVVENMTPAERAFCDGISRDRWQNISLNEDLGGYLKAAPVQGPGLLVLNDSYYPGWTARDRFTGAVLDIRPANINFRAIVLPENRLYEVEYLYAPTWLIYSKISIAMAVVTIGAGLLVTWRRKKKN